MRSFAMVKLMDAKLPPQFTYVAKTFLGLDVHSWTTADGNLPAAMAL